MLNVIKKLVVTICAYGVMIGNVEACSVNIEVTGETTVPAGAEPLALGAKTSDCKKTTFQWNVKGVGSLDEPTEQTLFYTPPSTIEGTSKQAIISVTVTEADGNEASDSVTLTIVRGDSPVPTPEPTPTSGDEKLIFSEDFEKGRDSLKEWDQLSSKIEIVECGEYGKCVKISRRDRNGSTILTKKFRGISGTLRFEVMIRAEDVVKGQQPFESGKLHVVVENPGNTDWTKAKFYANDFEGSFDWIFKSIEVVDLDGTKDVKFQTGLQSAKGAMYIDNVKVYHRP